MNFLLGILLALIIIFIIYNFMYISVSDNSNTARMQYGSNGSNGSYYGNNRMYNSNAYSMEQQTQQPQPILSKSLNYNISSLSNKQPIYDYNKYFFIP